MDAVTIIQCLTSLAYCASNLQSAARGGQKIVGGGVVVSKQGLQDAAERLASCVTLLTKQLFGEELEG